MPKNPIYHTLLLILFILHIHHSLSACPLNQTPLIQDGINTGTCVPQAIITAHIRPTLTDFVYLLIFEGGQVPFTSTSDFNQNTDMRFTSDYLVLSNAPENFTSLAIADDLSIIQVTLNVTEIPYGYNLKVSFTDFGYSESRVSNMAGPVTLALEPTWEMSASTEAVIDAMVNVDYILEFVWIVLALVNPYWIMYMDAKFYRETMNLLKYTSVSYEPFLTTFYRMNENRKMAGIRLPNLFTMLIFGDHFQSDWTKNPEDSISYGEINANRIDDLRVLGSRQVLRFTPFTLFLDNYGAELMVILVLIIILYVMRLMYRMMDLADNEKPWVEVFKKVREVLISFLLMSLLGSCQSMIFFAGVQIQGFFYQKSIHNIVSFAVGMLVPLILIPCTIVYVIKASRKRIDDFIFERIMSGQKDFFQQRMPIKFLDTVLSFYKTGDMRHPLTVLYIIPRAIVFAAVILLLQSSPVTQTAVMFSISAVYIISLIIMKPFWRPLYRAFKFIFEGILFVTLIILLILSVRDDKNVYIFNERSAYSFVLLGLWMAVPITTIVFACCGVVHVIKQIKSAREKKKNSVKVAPTIITDGKARQKPRNMSDVAFNREKEQEKKKKKGKKQQIHPERKKELVDLVKFRDPSAYVAVNSLGGIPSLTEVKEEGRGELPTGSSETELQLGGSNAYIASDNKLRRAGMSTIMDVAPEEECSPELAAKRGKKFNRPRQRTLPLDDGEGQEEGGKSRRKARNQTEVIVSERPLRKLNTVGNASLGGSKIMLPDSIMEVPTLNTDRSRAGNKPLEIRMTPRSLICEEELEIREDP